MYSRNDGRMIRGENENLCYDEGNDRSDCAL